MVSAGGPMLSYAGPTTAPSRPSPSMEVGQENNLAVALSGVRCRVAVLAHPAFFRVPRGDRQQGGVGLELPRPLEVAESVRREQHVVLVVNDVIGQHEGYVEYSARADVSANVRIGLHGKQWTGGELGAGGEHFWIWRPVKMREHNVIGNANTGAQCGEHLARVVGAAPQA